MYPSPAPRQLAGTVNTKPELIRLRLNRNHPHQSAVDHFLTATKARPNRLNQSILPRN